MSVRSEVLSVLEAGRGTYFSGQELAEQLSVSRSAVWKAIRGLRQEGHMIEAVPNRGYCLLKQSRVITSQAIARYLSPRTAARLTVETAQQVDSTNNVLKRRGEEGAPEGMVLAANEQTAGKGRHSRSFFSPSGMGVYFSILLRPALPVEDALFITTAAAVAVAGAVRAVTGRDAGIKWVNDVFVDGRKICGILTEGSMDLETGGLQYAVLGIGINVECPPQGFPESIRDVAGALYPWGEADGIVRGRLVAEVLNRFLEYYDMLPSHGFMEAYRTYSIITGKDILVLKAGGSREARALAIDDDAHLLVEYADGSRESLSSGEVSIRRLPK